MKKSWTFGVAVLKVQPPQPLLIKNVPQLLDKLEALNNDHVMCFVIFLALHLWGVVLFSYFSTLHLI